MCLLRTRNISRLKRIRTKLQDDITKSNVTSLEQLHWTIFIASDRINPKACLQLIKRQLEFEAYFKNFRKSAAITDIRRLSLDQNLQNSRNIVQNLLVNFYMRTKTSGISETFRNWHGNSGKEVFENLGKPRKVALFCRNSFWFATGKYQKFNPNLRSHRFMLKIVMDRFLDDVSSARFCF